MPRGRSPVDPAHRHEWLFSLLVRDPVAGAWDAATGVPQGFGVTDRYLSLPAAPGRTFLVSLSSRRAAASALTSYNALRPPRRRLARRALGLGLRTGLVQRLPGTIIEVGTATGATGSELAGALLGEFLRTVFGRPVALAVGTGSDSYRKPVLQAFGADGTPLGYVKVGWNTWSTEAVRREAAALRACAAQHLRLGVPALLHHATWQGLELLVTAPLPPRVRRVPEEAPLPEATVLREIAAISGLRTCQLAVSAWWQDLRARIQTAGADPAVRADLTLVADHIESSSGDATLEFGRWHGDFVPWNLARCQNRLYAWDWESSAAAAPLGFDALHFCFQVAFVARQRPLAEAAAFAARRAAPALAALGVAAGSESLVAALHLLELAVRQEEARRSTGDRVGAFHPAAMSVLARSLGLATARQASEAA